MCGNMKNKLTKIICLALLPALLCTLFCSCGKKQPLHDDQKTPYDATVPAAVSPDSGIGRDKPKDPEPKDPTGRTIVVDPGHGFVDGGCGEGVYIDGTLEKDITLAIAKLLDQKLQLLGYKTIVTHDGENIPAADTNGNKIYSASERVAYVNTLNIDYLVSIHVDSFDDPDISGMHIYYQQSSAKVNSWGADVAKAISDSISDAGSISAKEPSIRDGTAPGQSFAMARDVTAASSLIEIGYVTNPAEAANMIDPEWQEKLADAIAAGIDKFFTELDGEQ